MYTILTIVGWQLCGEQFLLRNKFFRILYKEIVTKVKEFASTLNININMIVFICKSLGPLFVIKTIFETS